MICLDNQATTPLAPEAREAMLPGFGGPETMVFGNLHSAHRLGRQAITVVEFVLRELRPLAKRSGSRPG